MATTTLTYYRHIHVHKSGAKYQNSYEYIEQLYRVLPTLGAALSEAETVLRQGGPITIMYARTAKRHYCVQLERDGSLSVERT